MLYLAYQTQSDIMVPVRAWAAMAVAASGSSLLAENSATRNLTAAYELIARAGLTHTRPAFGIGSVTVGNRAVEVSEEAAAATPFGTLLHFKKHAATAQPDADGRTDRYARQPDPGQRTGQDALDRVVRAKPDRVGAAAPSGRLSPRVSGLRTARRLHEHEHRPARESASRAVRKSG